MKEFSAETEKVLENLRQELVIIRTSRASAGILDGITVPYYGQEVPIKSCAAINIPDQKTIEIHPWEEKMASVISSAIMKSNIGVNPQIQGGVIRLTMPPMSVERRQQVSKIVHNICEEHRVSVRNLRRKKMDSIAKREKDKEITKDERRRLEKEIQKTTDEKIAAIDEIGKKKETEIMDE